MLSAVLFFSVLLSLNGKRQSRGDPPAGGRGVLAGQVLSPPPAGTGSASFQLLIYNGKSWADCRNYRDSVWFQLTVNMQ